MSVQNLARQNRTAGTILFFSVIALSAPSAFYGLISFFLPGPSLSRWIDRVLLNIPILSDIVAVVWFVVLFGGRYLLAVAFVLNLFLVVRREISPWLRIIASACLVLGLLGSLLVESQAGNVRH